MDQKTKMYSIVSKYDPNKMDRKSYSAKHGITLNVFCYWRGKWLADQKRKTPTTKSQVKATPKKAATSTQQNTPAFVPFEVEASAVSESSTPAEPPLVPTLTTCEITYPNGVQLKLSVLDVTLLEKLLRLDV